MIASKASDLQAQIVQQQIVAEAAKAQEIDRTAQTRVQEAEGRRRQMELEATVIKVAEADKQRVTQVAEAEKQRMSLEADGRAAALRAQAAAEAEAAKVRGAADAEAARLRGMAEADVIRAKGEAEAEAMRVKAAAYNEYNQAAVLDKVITNLPEVVRAIAEPLAKVDKISIVSTGGANGSNLGASRVTGDVVNMLAQMPVILEALTGVKMSDLMARVPGLRTVEGSTGDGSPDGANRANGANGASETPATPTVQRVKVPAPEADETPAPSVPVSSDRPSTNNSASGTSGGPTTGPRKQPMR